MSDSLRIDLALARAAGLPERAANDARQPLPGLPTPLPIPTASAAPGDAFSPLALLLARFLPPAGAATPPAVPTPDEARLLQAYLQQRVVTVLRADAIAVPASLRVEVDADGALRLSPALPGDARYAPLLRQDPDIAQLAAVLQRALLAQAPVLAHAPAQDAARGRAADTRDVHAPWSWWLPFDAPSAPPRPRTPRNLRALRALAIAVAVLWLAWWLLG